MNISNSRLLANTVHVLLLMHKKWYAVESTFMKTYPVSAGVHSYHSILTRNGKTGYAVLLCTRVKCSSYEIDHYISSKSSMDLYTKALKQIEVETSACNSSIVAVPINDNDEAAKKFVGIIFFPDPQIYHRAKKLMAE